MWRLTIYQEKKGNYSTGEQYEYTESVSFKSNNFRDLVDLVVTAESVSPEESIKYEIEKESEE